MPRIVACAPCAIIQRIPDPPAKTPMTVARLEWESGEEYVYKDEHGHPIMVPAYDPVLEHFVEQHQHHLQEQLFVDGRVINVWHVDQKTWDTMDVVTKIKKELNDQTQRHFEERDEYREAAISCYNAHGNPDLSDGCRDFMTDEKRIGAASYKVEGRVHNVPNNLRVYLCHMCPYFQSYVQVEIRRKQGGYSIDKAMEHRKRERKQARRVRN